MNSLKLAQRRNVRCGASFFSLFNFRSSLPVSKPDNCVLAWLFYLCTARVGGPGRRRRRRSTKIFPSASLLPPLHPRRESTKRRKRRGTGFAIQIRLLLLRRRRRDERRRAAAAAAFTDISLLELHEQKIGRCRRRRLMHGSTAVMEGSIG